MGTPDFAVESLRALVEGGYRVVAVVTMPDKPAGRGHRVQYSAVKEYALAQGIPLLQPERLKDEEFLAQLRSYNADLQIVVAFRMLPEVVWSMPPYGTFNLHASLLPQYRGAAPINRAVMNGEQETGVTTFFLQHEIDTGHIIFQERTPIDPNETAGSLHDRLMSMGGRLVTRTVDAILSGNVPSIPQENFAVDDLLPAPKIFKETCRMDFTASAYYLHNFVRGLAPYPTAWCELTLPGQTELTAVKVFAVRPEIVVHSLQPGTIESDKKNYLRIAVPDGYIYLLEIQLPGKKRMTVTALLNGLR